MPNPNELERLEQEANLYGYKCFYKGREIDVYAKTSYEAQQEAAKRFKAKKTWEVSVYLCERPDGSQVVQTCD